MKRPVLIAALALASIASAQRGPLPGIPLVSVVNHPALAAQPLIQNNNTPRPATAQPATAATAKAKPAKRKPVDPATVGAKASGRELKKLIEKVTDLEWRKSLLDMKARSAATGKPILYLQALGDLKGAA